MSNWTLLVNLSLKSSAVLVVAWLVTVALRRRSAAIRHTVWTTAFGALLAMPLLSISLPGWPNRLATALLLTDSGVTFHAESSTAATTGVRTSSSARTQRPLPVSSPSPRDFRPTLTALWATGALLFLLQSLLSHARVRFLRGRSQPFPFPTAAADAAGGVPVLQLATGMPMAAGVIRPVIFVPAEASGWDPERLRLVLAHESAHIRRGDTASQLLARLALCLHWCNPLAWIAWRESLKERERAADDLVLETGARASDYAGHLLEIARSLQPAAASAAAAVAMARRSQLEGRLLAILDSNTPRGKCGRAVLAASILAGLTVAIPLATVRAQSQIEQSPADVQTTIAAALTAKNHELLEKTAISYEKLRKFDEAKKLLEAALALRKDTGKAEYAEGLIQMGELAQRRNAPAEAHDLYLQAVQLGDMPQTVPALVNLGLEAAFHNKDLQLGRDYLQRARNVARSGNEMGQVMTWLGLLDEEDPARAANVESLYRTALSVEDPDSPARAFTTEILARFLRNGGRADEANALQAQAAAMRRVFAAQLSPQYTATSMSPRRVGAGVTPPKLLLKIEPSYSEEARSTKLQGTVLVKVIIDVDGIAKNAQILRGVGMGLDEKAVEAISHWRFQPGQLGGAPIPVEAQIEVNFRLM